MIIDAEDDDRPIPLREACRLFPGRNGRPIGLVTVYRWSLHGCRGIKLGTFQVGSVRCTSLRLTSEFCATLTAQRDGQPVEARTPAAVRRSQEAKQKATAAALDSILGA